jgi:hypothetical protein
MRSSRRIPAWLFATMLSLSSAAPLFAQQTAVPSADDKTGTNPLNIQAEAAVSNEFQSLPDTLFRNNSRYRYVTPLARRTMSAAIDILIVASNVTGRTEAAFGDLSAQWQWIPWIGTSKGVVVCVDTTWRTSTNDALGAGRHTVAPFAQMVFPYRTIVAAVRYAQRQSIGADADRLSVSQGIASLYLAWLPVPAVWLIAEPQTVGYRQRRSISCSTSGYCGVFFSVPQISIGRDGRDGQGGRLDGRLLPASHPASRLSCLSCPVTTTSRTPQDRASPYRSARDGTRDRSD